MTRAAAEIALDALDFAALVRPGDSVIWTQGTSEPTALLERLLAQRHAIGRFGAFASTSYTGVVRPEHADAIDFVGLGAVGGNRALCKAGVLAVIPCNVSDVPRLIADGRIRVDVALLQLSERADGGALSLGPFNGYIEAALRRARVVIGEINDRAPWTHARAPVERGAFDLLVRTSRPPVEAPARPPGDADRAIGAAVAPFVGDGAVLQIGIGGVPAAVLARLADRRDLGLHSGVIGDEVVGLIEAGVITNARKPVDAGRSVTGGLLGTQRLYRFADRNPALLVEPVGYTHDPAILARLDRLTAINGALEVDLTGQVNAEIAGGAYVGTVGGQLDFVRGALAARGGRSIIGLASRTERGAPRIVARIAAGVVTTPRADADVVATEHGAAELRGQPIRERVRRMIAIAHPDDREGLARAARDSVVGA